MNTQKANVRMMASDPNAIGGMREQTFVLVDFAEALRALKQGARIARVGWNGKNMWLSLDRLVSTQVAADNFAMDNLRVDSIISHNSLSTVHPCIVMKTADGSYQPGWLASQADMLAEDWIIYKT